MQFPRVWEDDANSNDSTKEMLHMLRDQLGRTPRGRYRSARILTEQQLPEQVQRTSPTAHYQLGPDPTPDGTHAVQLPNLRQSSGAPTGFFRIKSCGFCFRLQEGEVSFSHLDLQIPDNLAVALSNKLNFHLKNAIYNYNQTFQTLGFD